MDISSLKKLSMAEERSIIPFISNVIILHIKGKLSKFEYICFVWLR